MVNERYNPAKLVTAHWDVEARPYSLPNGERHKNVYVYVRGILWGRRVHPGSYWELVADMYHHCPLMWWEQATCRAAVRYAMRHGKAPKSWWHAAGWGMYHFFKGFF